MTRAVDIAWAAGFLEGEGCFSFGSKQSKYPASGSVQVSADQVASEPLDKMSALFGGRVYFYFKRGPDKNKAVHAWRVYGERAVGLMFTVYTFMSPKRRRQITRALEQWRAAPGKGWHGPLCRNGHERALYSYRIPAVSGKRHCRMCERASSLRVTARRRAARAA